MTQQAILDVLPTPVVVLDASGTIIFLNAAWHPVSTENCLLNSNYRTGQNYVDLCEKALGDRSRDAHAAAVGLRRVLCRELTQYSLQYRCHSPSDKRWFRLVAVPLPDSTGGAMVIHTDITDLVLAERRIREQSDLLDKAQDAIILKDLDDRILFWNKGAERLYGWTKVEALGQRADDLLYKEKAVYHRIRAEVMERGSWIGDASTFARDSREIIVETRWTLVRDNEEKPSSFLVINTDVTEKKKLELQFLRAQRLESIGTLAGGIAHDLNNLLAPIVMGVDLLNHMGLHGQSQQIVDNIGRSAKRGSNLVRQVLSFARGVEGSRVAVHIDGVIRELESIINDTFPKNITLEAKFSKETWLTLADPTQLNQVLLNLCVNARDAMPTGGRLTISAENTFIDTQYAVMQRGISAGRFVRVEVTDNGCGIKKENIDKIFTPFFTTKEMGQGTGLGLATTLGIVRSHGGFINVYSEVGRGTSFKVYLPAQSEESTSVEVEVADDRDWPRGNGEWILLVDDETSILTITQQTLEAFGYHVLTAEHGAQAVSIFAVNRDKISLVLTDMMMPIMDGLATIVALRQIDSQIKIVAASGLNANGTLAKAEHAGAEHFLSKPYTTGTMLTTIKAALANEVHI